MSQIQWKQFVQLFGEKNQHLNHKQVLQQAKKPFQQLLQYYQKGGDVINITIIIKHPTTGTSFQQTYKADNSNTAWFVVYENGIKNPDDVNKYIYVDDYDIYIGDENSSIISPYVALVDLNVTTDKTLTLVKK